MNKWNPKANEIFLQAVLISEPAERQEFVDATCAQNDELRQHVRALLRAYLESGQFLAGDVATVVGQNQDTEPQQKIPTVPSIFQPGKRFANQFVIREVVGWGGMGIVALADQFEPISRTVAIKINRPEHFSPGLLARFEQERKVLAMMQHPNIAKVLQAGYVDLATGNAIEVADGQLHGHPYLIMEYIDGEPIHLFCDAQSQTLEQRVGLIIDVCHAVQHAHSKGIIHRDLKPSNILIEMVDGKPVPRIIDFGISKPFDSDQFAESIHTDAHHLIGTIDYMSPEQSRFSCDIDTRTDVYSLGAVLYELLVGSVPLVRDRVSKDDLLETLRLIQQVDPPRPSVRIASIDEPEKIAVSRASTIGRLTRWLKGDADWITMRALEKDRQLRYQTAEQLAEDLQRVLSHEAVLARAPSLGYRISKTYRRHRFACQAAAAMLLVLIIGTVGTTIGFYRSSQNARQSEAGQKRIGQLLSQTHLEAAAAAVRRGQWKTAIENLDRIDEESAVNPIDVQLIRVDALNGMNRISEVREVLTQLENQQPTNSQLGRLRLWQADVALLDGDAETHKRLIREALELKLPAADEHYARCMIAVKTPDAIEHLERALAENPFHHRATQTLPILYLSLGRFEDARSQIRMAGMLFQDDPMLIAGESVILTMEGKLAEAEQLLAENSDLLPHSQLKDFQSLVRKMDLLRQQMEVAVQASWKSIGKSAFGFLNSRKAINEIIVANSLRIPLVVNENLAASLNAVGATFFGGKYEQATKSLSDVSERHPDGLLYYLNGAMLAVKRNWADAEKAFELAVEQPSFIVAVKPQAMHALIMTRCAIHLNDPINEQEIAELQALIAQRLAIQEPPANELGQLSKAAVMANDLNLARSLIQKAIRLEPESFELNVYLADIEFRIGNKQAAQLAAEHALQLAAKPQNLFQSIQFRSKLISTAKQIRKDSDF